MKLKIDFSAIEELMERNMAYQAFKIGIWVAENTISKSYKIKIAKEGSLEMIHL